MKNIQTFVKKVINEAAKINFAGHQFMLKVDTNEDPQKKGVKVQIIRKALSGESPTVEKEVDDSDVSAV